MILKTKIPHRVFLKDGTVKTYQPGYDVTKADQELYEQMRMHRLYRREVFANKLESSYFSNDKEGDDEGDKTKPFIKAPPDEPKKKKEKTPKEPEPKKPGE